MWDLVIVGAGPAGSAAALAATRTRPDARVLLLDRADFPRDKTCGDGIAPHVMDVLGDLGVTGVVDDWAPVRILELSRGAQTVSRQMRRPAWVVPRTVLDARLVEAAVAAGAVLRRHRVRRVEPYGDRVVVDGRVEARVVIGADGANSVVRLAAQVPAAHRRALAVRGYAPTPAERAGRQVIRFGSAGGPIAYAWSFDRGDGWSNVGYGQVPRRGGLRSTRPQMVERLEALLPGATSGCGELRGHHLPLSSARFDQPDGRILLAGDAAGLVNPLSGEGIFYAVMSGAAAGATAVRADGADVGSRYRRAMRRLLAPHWAATAAVNAVVGLPGVLPGALRAADRDQRVFDDLVELALGRGVVTGRVLTGLASDALG